MIYSYQNILKNAVVPNLMKILSSINKTDSVGKPSINVRVQIKTRKTLTENQVIELSQSNLASYKKTRIVDLWIRCQECCR